MKKFVVAQRRTGQRITSDKNHASAALRSILDTATPVPGGRRMAIVDETEASRLRQTTDSDVIVEPVVHRGHHPVHPIPPAPQRVVRGL